MRNFRFGLFLALAVLVTAGPLLVFGEEPKTGIVPCNGPDCKACDFVQLGQNLITWFIKISASTIALTFAWGGMKMVMSGGDMGAVSSARAIMTNSIIGLIIILGSWLIVNTMLVLFVDEAKLGKWYEVKCEPGPVATTPTPPVVGAPSGKVPVTTVTGCTTCTAIPSTIPTNGNACNPGSTCQIRPDIASRLTAVDLSQEGLRVSEAWPPTGYTVSNPKGIHASTCHGNATCLDISYTADNPNGAQVQGDIQEFKANNLTAQYEVPNATRQAELKQAGVTNVIVVAGINREHFSVYACDLDSSAKACK